MNKENIKWAAVLLWWLIFTVIICGIFTVMLAIPGNDDIVIYHTNDMHGNVSSLQDDENTLTRIGLDMVKSIKDNTPNSILVDCGDAIWGTQFAKSNKGLDIIDMMNAVGYNCMALGNHEFDYGLDALLTCAKRANFPVLSANTYQDGKLLLNNINGNNGENFILEVAGKKIGFFCLTTRETCRITLPQNLDRIEFKDEIETAKLQVQKLKSENVDIIVAITHMGIDASSEVTSKDVAKKVSGIDMIIDGHSHTEYIGEENGVIITQTGIGLSCLGKIVVKFKNFKPEITASLISASEAGQIAVPNSEISKMYDNIYSEISPSLEKVVGKIKNTLYGGTYNGINISRLTETNMGDFICDAMLESGKNILKDTQFKDIPIVAFENGGAVRNKIDGGYIKMDQIYSLFPLDNRLSIQIITPKILYQILERGVGKLISPSEQNKFFIGAFGGFPQVSGIKFEVNPLLEPYDYEKNLGGKRVQSIKIFDATVKTEKLLSRDDDKTKIAFIFNDYALYEFPSIKDIEIAFKGDYLYNIVSDYISNLTYENGGEFFYSGFNDRIIIQREFFKDSVFDSELILKDDTGKLNMVSVYVSIDASEEKLYQSDENAKIILKNLPSSGHIIKVRYGDKTQEIYINNEIGMKNNTVEFSDKFLSDISNVSNLIGQIPYDITKELENLIRFSRYSYDNLSEEQKSKILNYKKLQDAEERLRIINGEAEPNNIISQIRSNRAFLTITAVSVFILGMIVIYIFKTKRCKNI